MTCNDSIKWKINIADKDMRGHKGLLSSDITGVIYGFSGENEP